MMSIFKYKDSVFSSFEDLLEAMKMDGIVEEVDDWELQKYNSFKEYNADEFLRMAEKYRNECPPDLIRSSEKLWLAVVYTVKLFYLNIDVHLASHRSLSYFYDMAVKNMLVVPLAIRLDRAWSKAEKLHSFAYGTCAFSVAQFPELFEEIKFFVEEFPKIDSIKVQSEVNELIMDVATEKRKDIDFTLFTDRAKPTIGNKQFSPKYTFF
ncbi:unnamed protein product [Auanema sp. JU1783]|nr:unnamed protein product [Auanema sp. JU1783]